MLGDVFVGSDNGDRIAMFVFFKYTCNNIIYPDGVFLIRKMICLEYIMYLILLSFNQQFEVCLHSFILIFGNVVFEIIKKNTFFHIFFIVEPEQRVFLNIKNPKHNAA